MTPPHEEPLIVRGRRHRRRAARSTRPLEVALASPAAGTLAYPGYVELDDTGRARTFLTGSALLHLAAFGLLLLFAGLAPVIEETIIPVQILHEEPPPPPEPLEPTPAPKALAMRRNLPFSPAVQAVTPQVVNPRIIAEARPAVVAEALDMEAVATSVAPTQVERRTTVVERVSAVNTAVRARAAAVDVGSASGPVVRGPTRVEGPVGPSVGPRRVDGAVGTTVGTALQIGTGNGSSVREGRISDRDVVGSPEGALVVSIDTTLGQGDLAGTADGGSGSAVVPKASCMQSAAVQGYLLDVKNRTVARWLLPPGVDAGLQVQLRFQLDAAGSASKISIVQAQDHALGASAVDALRSAAPFPPMSDEVRCLARLPIVGTFSNPVGG
jgi:TonB family protein